jgi:hypothetical protein
MSSPLLSPGIATQEINFSVYSSTVSGVRPCIVGTFTAGPLNTPTLIQSVAQLIQIFGSPAPGNNLANLAAQLYLSVGSQLIVVRVAHTMTPVAAPVIVPSGVSTPSTATYTLSTSADYISGTLALQVTGGIAFTITIPPFTTLAAAVTLLNANTTFSSTNSLVASTSTDTLIVTGVDGTSGSKTIIDSSTLVDTISGPGALPATVNLYDTTSPTHISLLTINAVSPGTAYNAVQLIVSAGTVGGTFKIIVLSATGVQLEAYNNLSLSSASSNYIVTRINSVSNYINVTYNAAGDGVLASGTFTLTGGTDGTSGITDSDYIGTYLNGVATGMQTVIDPSTVSINIILVPGVYTIATQVAMANLASQRQDTLALLDAPQGLGPTDVYNFWEALSPYTARSVFNSSYACTHYPWVQLYDTYNSTYTSVPASAWALWTITNSANLENIWAAPAGILRGSLTPATGIDITLQQTDRDLLYSANINPIANFPGQGITVWGQKNLTTLTSALNRMNVRLMINTLKVLVKTATRPIVFQPNIQSTWRQFVSLVTPILRSMSANNAFNPVDGNGNYDSGFLIVADASVNTPAVVAQNMFIAQIFVRPALTIEFITLQFILTPQGATFSGDSTFSNLSSTGALGS